MTTRRILFDLEISQAEDELVMRARRMAVALSALAMFLLVPLSLRIAHQRV